MWGEGGRSSRGSLCNQIYLLGLLWQEHFQQLQLGGGLRRVGGRGGVEGGGVRWKKEALL